jgi:hypothetical membrane protein
MNLSSVFYYIAPLIGVCTLFIGICATLRPLPMSKKFGIAASESSAPYVISTGIRDVFMGLTVLILFYLQQWSGLGAINVCISIVAISDFKVVYKYGDKKTSYVHLAGAISVIVYGAWLLTR